MLLIHTNGKCFTILPPKRTIYRMPKATLKLASNNQGKDIYLTFHIYQYRKQIEHDSKAFYRGFENKKGKIE